MKHRRSFKKKTHIARLENCSATVKITKLKYSGNEIIELTVKGLITKRPSSPKER